MRRRDFFKVIGALATAWPLASRAQQSTPIRRIGVLQPAPESESAFRDWRMLFTSRLRELGWTDGENLQINYRFGSTGEAMSVGAMANAPITLKKSRRRIPFLEALKTAPTIAYDDVITAGIGDRRNGVDGSFCAAKTLSRQCLISMSARCLLFPDIGLPIGSAHRQQSGAVVKS